MSQGEYENLSNLVTNAKSEVLFSPLKYEI